MHLSVKMCDVLLLCYCDFFSVPYTLFKINIPSILFLVCFCLLNCWEYKEQWKYGLRNHSLHPNAMLLICKERGS